MREYWRLLKDSISNRINILGNRSKVKGQRSKVIEQKETFHLSPITSHLIIHK
jgi:hypothetical protein